MAAAQMPNPVTSPSAPSDASDLIAALKRRGVRISTPRRMIVTTLAGADGPLSAAQIRASLSVGLDLTTVYRNLDRLVELGLVTRIALAEGSARFMVAGPQEVEFVACESCGEVVEAESAALDAVRVEIRRRLGYEVSFDRVALSGRCPKCARSGS